MLFYFAGHGVAINHDDVPQGYLIPCDARQRELSSLIGMDELQEILQAMPCRHGILILDCCYSGAFKWSARRDAHFIPDVIYQQRFDQYVNDSAWQVITSTAEDQKALDSLDALSEEALQRGQELNSGHSPFAHALFDGLAGAADTTPKQGDGVITANELIVYLRNRVEDDTMANGQRQSPMIHALRRHDKGEYIFLDPNNPDNYLCLPQKPSRNPYRGRESYAGEIQDSFFYGRDRLVRSLKSDLPAHRLLVLSAPSGAGKTSLLLAGLLPNLWEAKWRVLPVVRPEDDPTRALDPVARLLREPDSAAEYDVLVIDEYEALLTQSVSAADREAFAQRLAGWLDDYPRLRLVIAVRADYEAAVPKAGLVNYWAGSRYTDLSFSRQELREAIVKPAEQAVLFFEPPPLVDALVDTTYSAPGGLPLLSIFLSRMYDAEPDRSTQRALRIEDMNGESDGEQPDIEFSARLSAKLHAYADRCYAELEDDERDCFGQLLSRLVTVKEREAAEDNTIFVAYRLQPKPADRQDLQFADADRTECVARLAEKLVRARLLTASATHLDKWMDKHEKFYELAHRDLLTWPRLVAEIKEIGEERLYRIGQLWDAVTEYEVRDRSIEYLWNKNPRLTDLALVFEDRQTAHSPPIQLPWSWPSLDHLMRQVAYPFNEREKGFLVESIKQKTKSSRRLWGIVLLVFLALSTLTGFALAMRSQAEENAEIAVANAKIAVANEVKAVANAEEARRRANDALNRLGEVSTPNIRISGGKPKPMPAWGGKATLVPPTGSTMKKIPKRISR